jgi:hypothetical protein
MYSTTGKSASGTTSPPADRRRRDERALAPKPLGTSNVDCGKTPDCCFEARARATPDARAPVFERPPSAVEVDRIVGADRALPAEGESVEELLGACAGVLAAGRRTTPTFFGYVQSPPAPVGVAADLLASAADQNLTSWRSGPAAAAVEHQTLRWLGEFVGFDGAATGILVSAGSAANLTALLVALRAVTGPADDRRATEQRA